MWKMMLWLQGSGGEGVHLLEPGAGQRVSRFVCRLAGGRVQLVCAGTSTQCKGGPCAMGLLVGMYGLCNPFALTLDLCLSSLRR